MKTGLNQRKNPFNHWLVYSVIATAALIVPLATRQQDQPVLLLSLLASVSASLMSLIALQLGWLLRNQRLFNIGTVAISFMAGASKSAVELWLLENLGLEISDPTSTILVAALSWAIVLSSIVLTLQSLGEDWSLNLSKRQAIKQARELHDSLEQQYEWLKLQQLEGLNDELAKHFVSLAKRLNTAGRVEESYSEIARELKRLARKNVRNRSLARLRSKAKPLDQISQLLTVRVNPLVTAALLLFSSLAFAIRNGNWPEVWVMILVMSVGLFGWLRLSQRTLTSAILTPVVSFIFGLATMLITGQQPIFAILQALAVALWSLAVLVLVASLELLRNILSERKSELSQELSSITSDSQWLSIRLEELNLEIAKYLHAVLQTRLMAFAIRMESTQLTDAHLSELRSLLSTPMREFSETTESLEVRLGELVARWQPVLTIESRLDTLRLRELDRMTFDLIQEAIGNAFYHGKASEIVVEVNDDEDRVITVKDNGLGPQGGREGMGSYLLRTTAKHYSFIEAADKGSVLSIQLQAPS